jgi:ssDNA thymidine ADP-ribosyltransferase, DarT
MSIPLSNLLRKLGTDCLHYWVHPSNVKSILERGILPYNYVHRAQLQHESLAARGVQARRNRITLVSERPLHDYVPLYLVRRTPMLWAIRNQPRVCVRVNVSVSDKPGTLFTDGNAASEATRFFTEPSSVLEMPWDVLRRKRWTGMQVQDGARKRSAEILVPEAVEVEYILDVICSPLQEIEFPLGHRGLREDKPWFLEP